MKKYVLLVIIALFVAIFVAACAAPTPAPAPTSAAPAAPLATKLSTNFGPGDIPTIDPAVTADTSSVQVIEEAFVGLVRQNEETGAAEPGLAKGWTQSSDGLKWTFTLNKDLGVKWVRYDASTGKVEAVKDAKGNERLVTAKDFEYGVKRSIDPRTASDWAVLNSFIKGAEDFNSAAPKKVSADDLKKLADGVGVKALDDWTIEFTMVEPTGFFPIITSLAVAFAQPQWIIEEKGDRWIEPGVFQSYGPYTVKEWAHEDHLTLIANPLWPGTPNIPKPKIGEIRFNMLDAGPALANYEAGKQDESGVGPSDLDRVKADPKLSKELKIAPLLCALYIGFNTKKPPFDNPKVRLAFSEAIDRQSLVDNVTKGGQQPAQWVIHPALNAAPTPKDYPNLGVKYNPDDAKKLLADAGYSDPSKLGEITYMYSTSESRKRIAEAFQQMWKKNLGVDVKVANQEWKVYVKTLLTDAPQIFPENWCKDYPDANNFSKEIFQSKVGYSRKEMNWVNTKYDDLVNQAARETDTKKRIDLYAQAEDILVKQDAAVAPIYWNTRVTLTKPYVTRTFANQGGLEHFEKWSVAPH